LVTGSLGSLAALLALSFAHWDGRAIGGIEKVGADNWRDLTRVDADHEPGPREP